MDLNTFFAEYHSNNTAGSGNQSLFYAEDPAAVMTARVYYRIFCGGRFNYSLFFSNIIDSTFGTDGSFSHANQLPGPWRLHAMRVGMTPKANMEQVVEPAAWQVLTFEGQTQKPVAPGELFCSDPFEFTCPEGAYMCIEMAFSGHCLPNHPESLLPAFRLGPDGWQPSRDLPFASMIGAARPVRKTVVFWGDSITQGLGTPADSYTHLAHLIAQDLGSDYAVWDLGLGFARAHDAASGGAWLYKALQGDVIVVCLGVNDLYHVGDEETLKKDLKQILFYLHQAGKKVVVQTIPPFEYTDEKAAAWRRVNDYLRTLDADVLFETAPILGMGPGAEHRSRYGAHPDERGNAAWAKALAPVLHELLSKL